MTLNEFKAWFDGFTENVSKAPTIKQWARIKERVGEINDVAVTERIYVDRWVTPYRPYWSTYSYWSNASPVFMGSINSNLTGAATQPVTSDTVYLSAFNSIDAMHAAGQAEAASMEN